MKYKLNSIHDIGPCFDGFRHNFFNSYGWYKNIIENVISVDKDSYHFVSSFEKDKEYCSITPIKVIKERNHTVFSSLTNYYSPIYKIISKEKEGVDFEKTLDYLTSLAPNWSVFRIDSLDEQELSKIKKTVRFYKYPSYSSFHFANWYLPVLGRSYEEYFEGLTARVRNTVERKTKALMKLKGAEIKLFKDACDIDLATSAYQSVYMKSWKRQEPYPKFIPGLIKLAAEQGSLRIGVVYIFGVPVASQLWIVADNSAYIFKLAYDEDYKKYSAGTVLTAFLMKYVIDIDKVHTVDFLSGDDAYKKEWMPCRRERYILQVFNIRTYYGVKSIFKKILSVIRV